MKRSLAGLLTIATLLAVAPARAQIPVTDVLNLVQNTLNEANTLQTTVNQATQIFNQMQSLANEAQNLKSMSPTAAATLLGNFNTELSNLNTAMGSIGGLANNLASLTSNYNGLYPTSSGRLTSAQLQAQIASWLAEARKTTIGAYQVTGQVMADLPNNQADINTAVSASNAATGNLQVAQTGNQILGQIAEQLVQLNAQLAAFIQAQTDIMSQQVQATAFSQQYQAQDNAAWTAPRTPTASVGQPLLH
ncbi:MAG: hypothetical protein M0T84_13425 [Betaproteobacteria bacterium]|nr:hypothetical protein [Betaproteobacteria bacterium]